MGVAQLVEHWIVAPVVGRGKLAEVLEKLRGIRETETLWRHVIAPIVAESQISLRDTGRGMWDIRLHGSKDSQSVNNLCKGNHTERGCDAQPCGLRKPAGQIPWGRSLRHPIANLQRKDSDGYRLSFHGPGSVGLANGVDQPLCLRSCDGPATSIRRRGDRRRRLLSLARVPVARTGRSSATRS